MKTVLAFIFFAGIISSTYSACSTRDGIFECDVYIQWNSSEGVAWAKDCDFVGHDMSSIETTDQSCGKLCLYTKKCMRFTWSQGVCYLKDNYREVAVEPSTSPGDICGYIPGRTDFARVGK